MEYLAKDTILSFQNQSSPMCNMLVGPAPYITGAQVMSISLGFMWSITYIFCWDKLKVSVEDRKAVNLIGIH